MKNNSIIIIFICLYSITIPLKAQKGLQLQSQKNLSPNNDNTIKIIEDLASREYISIFRNDRGAKLIKEGTLKGGYSSNDEYGIITGKGKRIVLEEDEELIAYDKEILFTVKTLWRSYSKIIKKYKVNGPSLSLLKMLPISTIEASIDYNNGKLIIMDTHEGGGASKFDIYSENLELIKSYIPYNSYFNSANYDSYLNNIFIGINPTEEKQPAKLVAINTKTGGFLFEKERPVDGYIISKVKAEKNLFIVHLFSQSLKKFKVITYNYTGTILWESDISEPIDIFFLQEQSIPILHLFTTSRVISFNAISGSKIADKKISSFYIGISGVSLKSNTYLEIIDVKPYQGGAYFGILLAETQQKGYKNVCLVLLDKGLNIQHRLQIGNASRFSIGCISNCR